MKFLRGLLKCLFWLLILALLVAPLGLIYQISSAEMLEYQTPTAPDLRESAYGVVTQTRREDVQEYVTVSGTFASQTYAYQDLTQRDPSLIRWLVEEGQEIQAGQVLGTYRGEDVTAELTGILAERNTYNPENAYLRVLLLEPLTLECRVSDETRKAFSRPDADLATEDGLAVTLDYISLSRNDDGTTTVRLSIEAGDYAYGQELKNLRVFTGRVYPQALVLEAKCLYQKEPGENNPWYVRQVTKDGYFVQEQKVGVGYSNGELVCVTGVSEGDYFDSGYKAIVEGG